MGMLSNSRRTNGKLYSFDRFQDYFEVDRLRKYLKPIIESGILKEKDLEHLGERARFIEIFKMIHHNYDYYKCIEPSDHGVPDLPEQVPQGVWMSLPDGFYTDAVFVDGCKSWYGTKYFMKLISKHTNPGTVLIFQDYGWFTCFWLVTFVGLFSENFQLIGHVDNTYVFSIVKPLNASQIEKQFPDYPHDMGLIQIIDIIDDQIAKAKKSSDNFAEVRHNLHKAAAYAYCGNLDNARATIKLTEKLPNSENHKQVIEKAWESPTYTPEKPIKLGKL